MHFQTSSLRIFISSLLCAISSRSAQLSANSGGEFGITLNYSKSVLGSNLMAKSSAIILNNGKVMPIVGLGENFSNFY